ncbi:UDP-N-acetylglucosamine 2-epimerase (non-hydrolyzing) [Fulvitalea axinellae]|uniref:UDP-N-acetylglucosamine 2-epimerase (Non-hydrolyzing) n=1 Tax=Fulvitalea axinellae TaxID=1182444 RepID=A0AAU9D279_9BACT|nr:UDP-N-acetylglucosamine 2-epimerase (non-hydrolyzing) [Fulvitalea axinellae]
MKLLVVVGTRPNFIKVTQFRKRILEKYSGFDLKIVHTGQHYDEKMADVFFSQFDLHPDYFLNISPNSPVKQMAEIMVSLEDLIDNIYTPDLIIVPGDVNSTLAAAIVANKKGIKLAHLESGLRSFDLGMPEEWNRLLVDEMADYYFVTEESGLTFLEKEGRKGKVFHVGNTMIDTMVAFECQIQANPILQDLNVKEREFVLMTVHRPSNVDHRKGIETLIRLLEYLDQRFKVVFPIHPRTRARIKDFGFEEAFVGLKNVFTTPPLDYFAFQKLIASCKMVLTDSGGIQEETTFRQVPCLTLRENTERPVTVDLGTNTLVPFDFETIQRYVDQVILGTYKTGQVPPFWDGKATDRILEKLQDIANENIILSS